MQAHRPCSNGQNRSWSCVVMPLFFCENKPHVMLCRTCESAHIRRLDPNFCHVTVPKPCFNAYHVAAGAALYRKRSSLRPHPYPSSPAPLHARARLYLVRSWAHRKRPQLRKDTRGCDHKHPIALVGAHPLIHLTQWSLLAAAARPHRAPALP